MKETKWSVLIDEKSFTTANENMKYDEQLLQQLPKYTRIERQYVWQKPSITLSYKQDCPSDLFHFDHAKRVTGGGIVFHSPGDIVFSLSMWLNDPEYSGSLSQKLKRLSKKIEEKLSTITSSNLEIADSIIDRNRCSMYPTPFEIMVDNKKILGLTIRKFKSKCLIQGILHVADSDQSFNNYINALENYSKLPFDIKSKLF